MPAAIGERRQLRTAPVSTLKQYRAASPSTKSIPFRRSEITVPTRSKVDSASSVSLPGRRGEPGKEVDEAVLAARSAGTGLAASKHRLRCPHSSSVAAITEIRTNTYALLRRDVGSASRTRAGLMRFRGLYRGCPTARTLRDPQGRSSSERHPGIRPNSRAEPRGLTAAPDVNVQPLWLKRRRSATRASPRVRRATCTRNHLGNHPCWGVACWCFL